MSLTARRWTFALAVLLGCLAGCGAPPGEATAESPVENPPRKVSPLRFVDVSAGSGITIRTACGEPGRKTAIPESLGQGAAALDYDGDGKLDLFVANGDAIDPTTLGFDPRPALYRNLGDLRFEDVTVAAGLDFRAWSHGASRVDFDSDGFDDLYVTVFRGANRFFRNRGDGTFEEASTRWGGADRGPSTAAAFLDADGDGDLDLYVGNYVDYDFDDPPNGGRPCEWRGLAVLCGPKGTTAAADTFYENRDGTLVDAGSGFGFDGVPPSYTLGAVAGDFDNDGDTDLYVANDSEPNYLFENLGGGRFRETAGLRGGDRNEDGRPQAGMGVDLGDLDHDGRFDLFVTNFSHDSNTLYRNLLTPAGETVFEDATFATRLGLESYRYLSWGVRIVDLDLDGWQDIVLVSGHVYPEVDRAPVGTTYRQRNQVFRNLGRGPTGKLAFTEFAPSAGDAFEKQECSRGLVTADLDEDGDADLLVVEMDSTPTLIRNDSEPRGHWIGFRLRDSAGNIDAIGARVAVEDSRGVVRWRQATGGGSFLSTSDPRIGFGLGDAGGPIRRVEVLWPSGASSEFRNLEPDRYWILEASSPTARGFEP